MLKFSRFFRFSQTVFALFGHAQNPRLLCLSSQTDTPEFMSGEGWLPQLPRGRDSSQWEEPSSKDIVLHPLKWCQEAREGGGSRNKVQGGLGLCGNNLASQLLCDSPCLKSFRGGASEPAAPRPATLSTWAAVPPWPPDPAGCSHTMDGRRAHLG